MMSCFSFCFQDSFSLAFNSMTMMCLGADIFEFILLEFIELLGYVDCFSSDLASFQPLFPQIFFLSLSLSSPSGTPITLMLVHLTMFYRSLRFCRFFFILFSFCSSDEISSIDLYLSSLTLSSICSSLLLSPYSEFFISAIVIFNPTISI